MNLIIPEKYDPVLSLRQTQEAIKYIRDTFQKLYNVFEMNKSGTQAKRICYTGYQDERPIFNLC